MEHMIAPAQFPDEDNLVDLVLNFDELVASLSLSISPDDGMDSVLESSQEVGCHDGFVSRRFTHLEGIQNARTLMDLPPFPLCSTRRQQPRYRRPLCTFLNFRGTRRYDLKAHTLQSQQLSISSTSSVPSLDSENSEHFTKRRRMDDYQFLGEWCHDPIATECQRPAVASSLQNDAIMIELSKTIEKLNQDLVQTEIAIRDFASEQPVVTHGAP